MEVIIYSTPQCAYCKVAKKLLSDNNVPYTEKNVVVDKEAQQEIINKSAQFNVPVIDIGGKILIGYDKKKMVSALKDKGFKLVQE